MGVHIIRHEIGLMNIQTFQVCSISRLQSWYLAQGSRLDAILIQRTHCLTVIFAREISSRRLITQDECNSFTQPFFRLLHTFLSPANPLFHPFAFLHPVFSFKTSRLFLQNFPSCPRHGVHVHRDSHTSFNVLGPLQTLQANTHSPLHATRSPTRPDPQTHLSPIKTLLHRHHRNLRLLDPGVPFPPHLLLPSYPFHPQPFDPNPPHQTARRTPLNDIRLFPRGSVSTHRLRPPLPKATPRPSPGQTHHFRLLPCHHLAANNYRHGAQRDIPPPTTPQLHQILSPNHHRSLYINLPPPRPPPPRSYRQQQPKPLSFHLQSLQRPDPLRRPRREEAIPLHGRGRMDPAREY